MAVVVIGTTEAFIVAPPVLSLGNWFIQPLRGHSRYKVILVKCDQKEVNFYRDMLREAVGTEGRVERIIQHFERQSIDVVVVEHTPKLDVTEVRFIGGGRSYATSHQQIVRVDDSLDSLIVQRVLDHAANETGNINAVDVEAKLEQLLAVGALDGGLTKIEY